MPAAGGTRIACTLAGAEPFDGHMMSISNGASEVGLSLLPFRLFAGGRCALSVVIVAGPLHLAKLCLAVALG